MILSKSYLIFLFMLTTLYSISFGMKQGSLSDIYSVLEEGVPENVEKCLRNGANPNQLWEDESLLGSYIIKIYSIKNKIHFYENIHLLLRYGADPNTKFKEQFFSINKDDTALHVFSRDSDQVEVTQLLLFYGADIYEKNIHEHIPLLAAVGANSYENVRLLIMWPLELAKAAEANSLLVKLFLFCTVKEKKNMYCFLLVLKRKIIKFFKPILVLLLRSIMGDSEKRLHNDFAQKIWSSDNPRKTAQEIIEKMLKEPSENQSTALSIAFKVVRVEDLQRERKKIKKLFEACIKNENWNA